MFQRTQSLKQVFNYYRNKSYTYYTLLMGNLYQTKQELPTKLVR
jgi:hypothetical protein